MWLKTNMSLWAWYLLTSADETFRIHSLKALPAHDVDSQSGHPGLVGGQAVLMLFLCFAAALQKSRVLILQIPSA